MCHSRTRTVTAPSFAIGLCVPVADESSNPEIAGRLAIYRGGREPERQARPRRAGRQAAAAGGRRRDSVPVDGLLRERAARCAFPASGPGESVRASVPGRSRRAFRAAATTGHVVDRAG